MQRWSPYQLVCVCGLEGVIVSCFGPDTLAVPLSTRPGEEMDTSPFPLW